MIRVITVGIPQPTIVARRGIFAEKNQWQSSQVRRISIDNTIEAAMGDRGSQIPWRPRFLIDLLERGHRLVLNSPRCFPTIDNLGPVD